MRDDYSDRIAPTFSVYPSPKISDVVAEPYNNILKHQQPKYTELNCVIGIAALLQFSSKLNGDLLKFGKNLVPFQRSHFFAIVQAPLFAPSAINVKAQDDKYLSASCALGYRGHIGTEELFVQG